MPSIIRWHRRLLDSKKAAFERPFVLLESAILACSSSFPDQRKKDSRRFDVSPYAVRVRETGLEPAWGYTPLGPQPSASANSAIPAAGQSLITSSLYPFDGRRQAFVRRTYNKDRSCAEPEGRLAET